MIVLMLKWSLELTTSQGIDRALSMYWIVGSIDRALSMYWRIVGSIDRALSMYWRIVGR